MVMAAGRKANGDFGASLATSGYQKLPSGLIVQWGGATTGAGGVVAWTLPIAFTTAVFHAQAIQVGAVNEAVNLMAYGGASITFNVWSSAGGVSGRNLACVAIGH